MCDDILQIEGYCYFTRPFPSFPGPLYQNEVKCSAFDMEMILHCHANKTQFHKRALSLILKVRDFGTQKWPIVHQTAFFFSTLVLWTLNEQRRISSKRLALLLTSFELAGLNALHVRSTLHQKYNFLSLELGLGRVLSFPSRLLLDILLRAK